MEKTKEWKEYNSTDSKAQLRREINAPDSGLGHDVIPFYTQQGADGLFNLPRGN